MIRSNLNKPPVFASCKCELHESKVSSGLALTPAQMWDMAQQGKPISTSMLPDEYFDDGDPYATYDVDLDRKRGIDVVELWEAEKTAKNKFRQFESKERSSE